MNASLFFFLDSLRDRSRRRQALSAFLILTFSLSWGWTWLAPAHPAPGEMTHSLFFKTQSNILTFELLIGQRPLTHRGSGMMRLLFSFSLYAHQVAATETRVTFTWRTHVLDVCRFVSKILTKKRLHSIFKMLNRGGIARCICGILWNTTLDTWQRQCSAFIKKRWKEIRAKLRNAFFFYLHFPGEEQNLANIMSLFQQCADRQIHI